MLQIKRRSMFPNLFEPGFIGNLWLKNRLIKGPIATGYAAIDGCVTERILEHYKELARGGAGLVITGYAYVDDVASKSMQGQLGVSKNEHRPGLQLLASTIKANGAKSCLQIAHTGREKYMAVAPIKAPSQIPWKAIAQIAPPPEELTLEEIGEIINSFGDAALKCRDVGFDMVEVHGAHGYLIAGFLSPLNNKRTDCYGGSLENRMRFIIEVVENIRKKVGPTYPLSVKLCGTDYHEGGITLEETKIVAKALEKAGANLIHLAGGDHESVQYEQAPMYNPFTTNVWAVEQIKRELSIPVAVAGAISTPELAEVVLKEDKADFVVMGRPIVADPYLPLKAQEGRQKDICPCIRCGECVSTKGLYVGAVTCAVNVTVGREGEFKITPVAEPKKVAVIGGGPAGMEAARIAAMRGHDVTLFEKRQLGGQLIEASVPEFKADLRRLIDYLVAQVKKAGVTIVNAEGTTKAIKNGKFDAVIVASGSRPSIPDVSGIKKPSVMGILDVLGGAETGKNVIVIGGGLGGCDVALYLAEQGKKVIVVEMLDEIAAYMNHVEHAGFLERLSKQDVDIRTGLHLAEVIEDGVIAHNRYGVKFNIKGDTVVLATGMQPNEGLFKELIQNADLEIYAVGDCVGVRGIFDAIHEGFYAGYAV